MEILNETEGHDYNFFEQATASGMQRLEQDINTLIKEVYSLKYKIEELQSKIDSL